MVVPTDWRWTRAQAHFLESMHVKQETLAVCMDQIIAGAELIATSFSHGGKLLLCGNGGSAADCQHMAAEFTNRLTAQFERTALPAIALTTDSSFITSYANDVGFEGVFARQIEAIGGPHDVLLGISTSGRSANVIRAVETAKMRGMSTIALTGCIGPLGEVASVAIMVPSESTQYIQEAHLVIEHILCDLSERIIFGIVK